MSTTDTSNPDTTNSDTTSPAGRTAGPDDAPPRQTRRRRVGRVLLAVGVLVAALIMWGVVQLASSPTAEGGPGDHGDRGRSALATLVDQEDVPSIETDTYGELRSRGTNDATVVVTQPRSLTAKSWQALLALRPGRIVLISPSAEAVEELGLPVTAERWQEAPATVASECDDPAADRAGAIAVPPGTMAYATTDAATTCYPAGDGQYLHLMLDVDGTEVALTPGVGTNGLLAREGNASLAMQTIGSQPSVMWWFPRAGDSTLPGQGTDEGGSDNRLPYPSLLPPGWIHAVGLSCVALVTIAIWRGRRLGPVLVEDLPSVVPASETVEGHGRLYGRLAARDTAAGHLRAAATTRLARTLGHTDDPEVLARALADRTGWSYGEIRHLLDGPAPPNDEQLVILKRKLDALEQEARRP